MAVLFVGSCLGLWSRAQLQAENQSYHTTHLTCFPSPGNPSPELALVQHQNTFVSCVFIQICVVNGREALPSTGSSVVPGSTSELLIHFNFPLIPPPETYRKTVLYSLLYVFLFLFFLNPPSASYHLPKYLAFKVLINTRN